MFKKNLFNKIVVSIAALMMLLPSSTVSAANAIPEGQQAAPVTDVSLNSGVLTGQIISSAGLAQINTPVSIRKAGQEVLRATTNSNGVFEAQGLNNGIYEVMTASTTDRIRAWDSQIAPPNSKSFVTIVTGDAQRGQFGGPSGMNIALVGLGIAATTVGIIAISSEKNSP